MDGGVAALDKTNFRTNTAPAPANSPFSPAKMLPHNLVPSEAPLQLGCPGVGVEGVRSVWQERQTPVQWLPMEAGVPSVPLWPKINPMRAKEQQIWADVQIKCFFSVHHPTLCVKSSPG